MIRRLNYIVLFLFIANMASAQQYGDEWIDYNKQYFKISVASDGIYRLSYADLVGAGFPVNSVDPRRLQLYHRGIEQAIHVQGQGDAVFNTADYIEFYGGKNDGTLDRNLYEPAEAQPHSYYNIYSDTTAYFLTYQLAPSNGKRMVNIPVENNSGGLPPEKYHSEEYIKVNADQYSPGQSFTSSDVIQYTYFDYGEGWTGKLIQEGESIDYNLTGFNNRITTEGNPSINILLVGRDDVSHQAEVFVGPNPGALRTIGTAEFEQYNSHLFQASINWSDIGSNGDILVRVKDLGVDGGNDRLSTSYIKVVYPQNFDVQGENSKKFYLPANAGNKSYVEVNNVPVSPILYDITDINNVSRIGYNTSGSNINAIINNTATSKTLLLNGAEFITPVLKKVSFRNIDASDHNYIIISNQLLRRPVGSINDPVKAYADYRASEAGGSFDTLSVNMAMLYNQFSYGEVSALAIYNFMRFMVNTGDPGYLLLIGKGLDPDIDFHRRPEGYIEVTKLGITYRLRDLVPSAGNPGSDIAFTAGLGGTSYEPAVPVGRIPAVNPKQVLNYLNKVKEMEAQPFDALWRKKLLHLSGGISANELSLFKTYTDGFAEIAEDDYLGGSIKTISKEKSSTVELINVADEVNDGLNLITFFGHSAPAITDIDIGFVTDPLLGYNNPGKYPMFLINGCNAGQFFNANILFGEDWILAEDKGAVGFIANSSYGFADRLRRYSSVFYNTAYADSVFISRPIGDVQQEVVKRFMENAPATPINVTQVHQMVLLGDPALDLFGAEYPDYETNNNNIFAESFTNDPLSAQMDSFALKAIVRNFGRTNNDSIRVRFTRTFNDNTVIQYDSVYASVNFQDTLTLVIKNELDNGAGNNQFLVELDYFNEIEELNEGNNSGFYNVFIPLFGTKNLYPVNYAIVSEQPVELLVQASDLLSGTREFIIEIDTTKNFDSPFKKTNSINARLLASWKVDLLQDIAVNDSTVYFWRSKFASPQEGESEAWQQSSFIYIKDGPSGWSQSKFSQLDNNLLNGLVRDENGSQIKFEESQLDVYIKTYGAASGTTNQDISLKLNGTEFIINNGFYCRNNAIGLIAFDKNNTLPYLGVTTSRGCGRLPQVINNFIFNELESGNDDLIEYIDNINEGDSVILFTIGNPKLSSWSATVRSKLEEIGASAASLSTLQDGEPYILFGKKGSSPGTAIEVRADQVPANEQEIELDETITGIFSSGKMVSTLIGPASQWQTLVTRIKVSETPVTDLSSFDVTGITITGDEQLLKEGESLGFTDLSDIDPNQYPFLKLTYNTSDDINLTAAQLVKWQVYYTGVPEGILLLPDGIGNDGVEKAEGDKYENTFGFKNISSYTFPDSIRVDQTIFNQASRISSIEKFNIKSPEPGDTAKFTINLATMGKGGENDFTLFVNPREYPEQYYDNNIFDKLNFLKVNEDNINPLIDVAFDGEYILDGDIVSPSPLISIRLKDENKFILKKDTSDINVFLKRPCENCTFERKSFSSTEVSWFAADENNEFKIEYNPQKLEDGIYSLRVEAKDASGNPSGAEPYEIRFEVVNESSITNFYPYPNPFSSNTRFIFTLTGNEIPDQIKIQIITVSGKIVREITQDELGLVKIGNNISDYAWDGKDEYGDQLANGVYLYRVIIRQNGQPVDHRKTAADKAFKNGFGKLYLLR